MDVDDLFVIGSSSSSAAAAAVDAAAAAAHGVELLDEGLGWTELPGWVSLLLLLVKGQGLAGRLEALGAAAGITVGKK